METNNTTEENNITIDSLDYADMYFFNHRRTFTGINAGEYLDKEDFMTYANNAERNKEQDKAIIDQLKVIAADYISVLENERSMIGTSLYKTSYYKSLYKSAKKILNQLNK